MMRRSLLCSVVLGCWLGVPVNAQAQPLHAQGLTVGEDGQVMRGSEVLGRLPLPPGPRSVTVARPLVMGRELLHVRVQGAGGRAAELLLDGTATVFSGLTGPRDPDGESSLVIDVRPTGIIRRQDRDGALRCDGRPALLFPEMFDFSQKRFRPVAPREPDLANLPLIRASRHLPQRPLLPPSNTFRLVFASTQTGDEGQAANLGAPVEAQDGKLETAWSEDQGGYARGAFLTARALPSPYPLQLISLIPGETSDGQAFRRANRLRSVLLLLSPTERYRVVFEPDPLRDAGSPSDPYFVALPIPSSSTCATLVIDEVYPGDLARTGDGGRTAIAEVAFFTTLELRGRGEQLVDDLASPDRTRREAAASVLSGLGDRGVALVRERIPGAAPTLRSLFVRILAANRSSQALAALCSLLPGVGTAERRIILDALVEGGQNAVAAAAPYLRGNDEGLAEQLAPVIGRLGGSLAFQELLQSAGQGGEARRAAVVQGLSLLRGDEVGPVLIEAALTEERAARRADLILALGRQARGSARAPELAARLASSFEAASDFEVRYRLLGAVGQLDGTGQLALLQKAASLEDPHLRALAIEQIRRLPGPQTQALLLAALGDSDPRVRAAAAMGLGEGRPLPPSGRRELARRLRREAWGLAAGPLCDALGHQCSQETVAALRETVRLGERGHGVDGRALASLVRCRPRGLATFLLAMAEDERWRTGLRERALDHLDPPLARELGSRLGRLFAELGRRAARSEADEKVAVAAAGALAVLGDETAAQSLADALALSPLPTIRLASALALGKCCSRTALPTLRRAAKDSDPRIAQAATQSLRSCGY